MHLRLGEHARDDDDRDVQAPDALHLQEVGAADAGQPNVEEHDVRPDLAQQSEGGLGRVGEKRLVADLHEVVVEDLAEPLIIFDDEYAHSATLAGHSGTQRISNERAPAGSPSNLLPLNAL